MKMIVGLGNPGKEYELTRNNMGFMFIDNFASSVGVSIDKNKFNANYVKTNINNQDVLLVKPLSFINLSGEVVSKFVDYFKINIDDILIISDDLDQELGHFKLKAHGSSGGHNGLKNIEANLHTDVYKRLKIGISNNKLIDTKDYVLGKLNKSEVSTINELYPVVNNILSDFISRDFSYVMNIYNRK